MSNFNDGAIPYGSRVEAFKRPSGGGGSGSQTVYGTALGSYVLENIMLTRPSYPIKRYDEVRNPNGAAGVDDWPEITATAQLATGASKLLRPGDGFTDTFDTDLGAESWVCISSDQALAQGDYWKQSVRFQKLFHTTV